MSDHHYEPTLTTCHDDDGTWKASAACVESGRRAVAYSRKSRRTEVDAIKGAVDTLDFVCKCKHELFLGIE
jgi:hypothetical protein